MTSPLEPYNPLAKENLGKSVADALLDMKPIPLAAIETFRGAGIYSIYFLGEFEPYARIAARNRDGAFDAPIYVGKAIPAGSRKGGFGLDADPGTALHKRLKEHAKSIQEAQNLDVADFQCRFLVVDDIWIPLGENLLIARFSPIWNHLIDGFGNHDPGSGRYNQLRSRWDVLHPGRGWAPKCKEREETGEQIADEVAEFLKTF